MTEKYWKIARLGVNDYDGTELCSQTAVLQFVAVLLLQNLGFTFYAFFNEMRTSVECGHDLKLTPYKGVARGKRKTFWTAVIEPLSKNCRKRLNSIISRAHKSHLPRNIFFGCVPTSVESNLRSHVFGFSYVCTVDVTFTKQNHRFRENRKIE